MQTPYRNTGVPNLTVDSKSVGHPDRKLPETRKQQYIDFSVEKNPRTCGQKHTCLRAQRALQFLSAGFTEISSEVYPNVIEGPSNIFYPYVFDFVSFTTKGKSADSAVNSIETPRLLIESSIAEIGTLLVFLQSF